MSERIEELKRLILENGRNGFNAPQRSKGPFVRRQSVLYSALIQEERYEERKAEEAVRELLEGA